MAHSTSWYVENRIMKCVYTGDMTPEDVKGAAIEIMQFADTVPTTRPNPRLHVIFLIADNAIMRSPIKDYINDTVFEDYSEHPIIKLGWSLYLGRTENNPFWQFITSAINHNAGLRMRWFTKEADLINFIYDQDEELDRFTPKNQLSSINT